MASVGAAVDPQTELESALEEIERQRIESDGIGTGDVSDSSDFSDNTGNENEGAWGSDGNSVNLQQDQDGYGNRPEQNNDERAQPRQADGGRVAGDTARGVEGDRDRSDIRVYEEGLAASRDEHSEHSERNRREAESERLVSIARQNGHYVGRADYGALGERYSKRSGESEVYVDRDNGRVYKVKNPYAKAPMKGSVQPEDAIVEHLVHNKYFPETTYRFEGISDDAGDGSGCDRRKQG